MARDYKRVVQLSSFVLPVLATITVGAGFYVGNKGGDPRPWFIVCGVSVLLLVLIPVLCWWVLPRLTRDHEAEASESAGERPVDPNPTFDSQRDTSRDKPEDELKVPPETLVLGGTSSQQTEGDVARAEERRSDKSERAPDEPNDR